MFCPVRCLSVVSGIVNASFGKSNPSSILYKSIVGRYRPVSYPDGPITARYRFIKNAYWEAGYFALLWFVAYVLSVMFVCCSSWCHWQPKFCYCGCYCPGHLQYCFLTFLCICYACEGRSENTRAFRAVCPRATIYSIVHEQKLYSIAYSWLVYFQ